MKKQATIVLMLLAISLSSIQCKKEFSKKNKELPPATREGKNTFGFLLNGEVWRPKGGILDQVLDLSYDPGYMGGSFNIVAKRYLEQGKYQIISISSDNITSPGNYAISPGKAAVYFDDIFGCEYLRNDINNIQTGNLTITRFDLKAKIISGTFEFKLEKEGCTTINATDGRFDLMIE